VHKVSELRRMHVKERIGITMVGCGSIGQIHAVGLAQLVQEDEIRAVIAVDPSEEARQAANRN
jgi:predicted dehydrogenase